MFRKCLFAAACLGLAAIAGSASALCAVTHENGSWRNVDPATRSITRAVVNIGCSDQVLNGRRVPAPSNVRLWGSCTPSDCDWGEIQVRRLDNGWLFGRVDQGFAKREVWAKMSGPRLRVYIRTDFADPGRADYNSDNYFVSR